MNNVSFQQESVVQFIPEAKDLLAQHWEEIAVNKDTIKMNPDWDGYMDLEERGALKLFTARHHGNLVGYFAVICRRHLHYMDHVYAVNDVIYLHKDFRKGLMGGMLVKFAEECLVQDGVSVLVVNTKRHKPFDSLLRWLGFTHVENVYSKLLRK